jgi:hypothetical protein
MRAPQLLCLVAEAKLRKYIISVLIWLRRFCNNFDADWRALLLLVIAWLVQCSKLVVRLIHYTLIWAKFVIHRQEKGAWVFKEGHGQRYLALICLLLIFYYSDPSVKFGVPVALCIGHARHGKSLLCPLLVVLAHLWRQRMILTLLSIEPLCVTFSSLLRILCNLLFISSNRLLFGFRKYFCGCRQFRNNLFYLREHQPNISIILETWKRNIPVRVMLLAYFHLYFIIELE